MQQHSLSLLSLSAQTEEQSDHLLSEIPNFHNYYWFVIALIIAHAPSSNPSLSRLPQQDLSSLNFLSGSVFSWKVHFYFIALSTTCLSLDNATSPTALSNDSCGCFLPYVSQGWKASQIGITFFLFSVFKLSFLLLSFMCIRSDFITLSCPCYHLLASWPLLFIEDVSIWVIVSLLTLLLSFLAISTSKQIIQTIPRLHSSLTSWLWGSSPLPHVGNSFRQRCLRCCNCLIIIPF